MFVVSLGIHFRYLPFDWFMYNKFYLLQFPPQI